MIGEIHGHWYRNRQVERDAFIDDALPAATCGGTFRFVHRFDSQQVLVACDECDEEWTALAPLDVSGNYRGPGKGAACV